jgi:hypothetical protein
MVGGERVRTAADREVAKEDALAGNLQPGFDLRGVVGRADDGFRLGHAVGHPPLEFAGVARSRVAVVPARAFGGALCLAVQHGDRLQRRDELEVLFVDVPRAHRPPGVDLGRVVGAELLGVLQAGDPTEQPLLVRVGRDQVGADADRRAVLDRHVGPQAGPVWILADREALRGGEDADATILPSGFVVQLGKLVWPRAGVVQWLLRPVSRVGVVGCHRRVDARRPVGGLLAIVLVDGEILEVGHGVPIGRGHQTPFPRPRSRRGRRSSQSRPPAVCLRILVHCLIPCYSFAGAWTGRR